MPISDPTGVWLSDGPAVAPGGSVGCQDDRRGTGRQGLPFHLVADAARFYAGEMRPVTGRIGGHRFERFVGPPGPAPADPEAIRTDGGCWAKLRLPYQRRSAVMPGQSLARDRASVMGRPRRSV